MEEADQNSCCLWVDRGGKVAQMFPDSSDACISIETLLSAHLEKEMLKKKKEISGGPGGEKMAGDGDHGYSPGTGVYYSIGLLSEIVRNVNFSVV